jgi:hypothetical protein
MSADNLMPPVAAVGASGQCTEAGGAGSEEPNAVRGRERDSR